MFARIFLILILMGKPALAAVPYSIRHEAQVRLSPVTGTIEINDVLTLAGSGRVALGLDAAFVVNRLSVDGVAQSPARRGNTLVINLGRARTHRIKMNTRASFVPGLRRDGGLVDGNWLAQPISASPHSRNSYYITLTTPPGQIAVMDGALVREDKTAQGYAATFTSTTSSVPVLFTGPYRVAEKIVGGVRIRTYFHPELAALSSAYLNASAKYIADYSKKIGPYPYAEFSIVSGNNPVGWGLPGLTYMDRRVLALAFIRTTSLPHEILHNWWGNAVRVDDATGNWAEGLTTYQADYAQAAAKTRDGGREARLTWLRAYGALPPGRDFPVAAFTSKKTMHPKWWAITKWPSSFTCSKCASARLSSNAHWPCFMPTIFTARQAGRIFKKRLKPSAARPSTHFLQPGSTAVARPNWR